MPRRGLWGVLGKDSGCLGGDCGSLRGFKRVLGHGGGLWSSGSPLGWFAGDLKGSGGLWEVRVDLGSLRKSSGDI